MCSNYPGIKLEPALATQEDKIKHLSSYAHVVNTPAKLVISRRRKNENVYKMSKIEKCPCKACTNTVFHCQICKFVVFLLPSSSWLLKLPTHLMTVKAAAAARLVEEDWGRGGRGNKTNTRPRQSYSFSSLWWLVGLRREIDRRVV